MELFKLPETAKVNRNIPKNAFDNFTTSKQRKLFSELVSRITWTHKISPETVNLASKNIREIQVIKVELKVKKDAKILLDIIDKAIPYNIIFVVEHGSMVYLSTSIKHLHPINIDNAVLDWTFSTKWFFPVESRHTINLKKDIDAVYQDFCNQLAGNSNTSTKPLELLVTNQRKVDVLQKEIARLKVAINGSRQFNKKVELNQELNEFEKELGLLLAKE